jgi:lysine 6-dehydrogenase
MKALVLGVGFQGKAVIHDLSQSSIIDEIIAADVFSEAAENYVHHRGYSNVQVVSLDATDQAKLFSLIKDAGTDIVICMIPPQFNHAVAKVCLRASVPFVDTSFGFRLADLDEEAKARGITILSDMGFDPGIDLLLARLALEELEDVEGLFSYGGGLPAPECRDRYLNYKITWIFERVLLGYKRPALMLKDSQKVSVPSLEIFNEENIQLVEFPGIGTLEAFPNGDATRFINAFGLGSSLKDMARFSLRWPGHASYWRIMAGMGFLDETPLDMGGGISISPFQFLVKHLSPRLQLREGERDLAVLRVQAWGRKNGRKVKVFYDLIDYRDLETGFFAMNRTVGYTASIAAQLILSGEISQHGVLSPARDVPVLKILDELKARNIETHRRIEKFD